MASGGEEREAPSTAGSEQSDVARLRFRTANPTAEAYDIGPQRLERTTKLADVKRLIFDKWPYGSQQSPSSPSDLKLVFSGRVLDSQKRVHTLADANVPAAKDLEIVTMHVLVSPESSPGGKDDKGSGPRCCAIQ